MYPRFNELIRDIVGLSKGRPEVHLKMFKRHSRTYVCVLLSLSKLRLTLGLRTHIGLNVKLLKLLVTCTILWSYVEPLS